jgi:cytochrome c oxidase subunit 2
LTPQAKIVAGFGPQMPPFQGAITDDEIKSIIEFLKTVK